MKFSIEQKELLEILFDLTQKGDTQPKKIQFEAIISEITPENCYVNFDQHIGGFRIYSHNSAIKDEDDVQKINGQILTYLFLIDILVKNNLIIVYKIQNNFNYISVFLPDRKGNELKTEQKQREFRSESLYSPSFWEVIEKYGNTVLQPSFSLIHLIKNDFKTDDEKATEKGLRKATTGLRYSIFAIMISLGAFIFSTHVGNQSLKSNRRAEKTSLESLEIEKEAIIYSKESSTELRQQEIIERLDSLPKLIEENNKNLIEELKKNNKNQNSGNGFKRK